MKKIKYTKMDKFDMKLYKISSTIGEILLFGFLIVASIPIFGFILCMIGMGVNTAILHNLFSFDWAFKPILVHFGLGLAFVIIGTTIIMLIRLYYKHCAHGRYLINKEENC